MLAPIGYGTSNGWVSPIRATGRANLLGAAGSIVLVAGMKLGWSRISAPMRRLRERMLRARDARRNPSLFDNAVAGILRVDAHRRPVMVNGALARILGYDGPDELLRTVSDVDELVADHDPRRLFEELQREPVRVELRTRSDGGENRSVSVLASAHPTESDEGALLFDVLVVDITPLAEAEESLRRLSGQLLRSQEDERRRIARDLHDSTGQILAALKMNLVRLDELYDGPGELVADSIALVDEASRQLRSACYLLHPPMLDEIGLASALRAFVRGFSERTGLRVELEAPQSLPRFDPDAELALFRVAQEALVNVQRHAESPGAIVRLGSTRHGIRLEVEDHGRGLDPSLVAAGVGMSGMRERLRHFMGRLSIESAPGRTIVRAEVPVSRTSRTERESQ